MEPVEANAAPSYRVLKTAGKMTRYEWSLAQDKSTNQIVVLEVSDLDVFENLNARDPLKRLMASRGLSVPVVGPRADGKRAFVVSAPPEGQNLPSALPGLTPAQRARAAIRLIETVGQAHELRVTLGAVHPSFYYWCGETVFFAAPGLSALCTAGGINGAELAGVLEDYAAPELRTHGPSSATDLFALGRFLKALAPEWSDERGALVAGLTSHEPEQRIAAFDALKKQKRGSHGRMAALAAVTATFFAACVVTLVLVLGRNAKTPPAQDIAVAGDTASATPATDKPKVPAETPTADVSPAKTAAETGGNTDLPIPDGTSNREETAHPMASVFDKSAGGINWPQVSPASDLQKATIVEKVDDRLDDADSEPLPKETQKRPSDAPPPAGTRSESTPKTLEDLLPKKNVDPPPEPAAPKEPEVAETVEEPGDFENYLTPLPRTPQLVPIAAPPAELTPAERKQVELLFQEAAKPVPPKAASMTYETFQEQARRTAILELGTFRHSSVTHGIGILMRNPAADLRKASAVALGKQDTADSTKLLVELFADADDSVTQAARKALSALRDAEAVQVLFDSILPRAVNSVMRAEAATALGLIGDPRCLPALRRSLKDPDGGVRGAAAQALGRLGAADAAEDLLTLIGDSDPRVRIGASLALGALRVEQAREKLETLLRDSAPAVRRAACKALMALRNPASIPALIRLLDLEPGGLKDDSIRALVMLTGINLEDRVKSWNEWWLAKKDTFRVPPLKKALKVLEETGNQAGYYGIRTYSKRIVFLIDISGSMMGQPLLQAKEKLIETFSGFTPQHQFNIIAFETELHPWGRAICPCTPENRLSATKFTNRLESTGTTNIYDAVRTALEDRNADTIFLLSDGAPSAGSITDPNAIRAAVRKLNRDRQATIHCIALGSADETFMSGLASDNNGQFVRVDQ